MIRFLLPLFLCALVCPLHAADGKAVEGPRIRVAIMRGSPALKLKTSARIYVVEVKTGTKYQLLANSSYEIRSSGNAITVAGQQLASPVKLSAADGGERVRLGGRLYKGDILIKAAGTGRIDIIESLSIEDYLCGVLPAEMSPDWPLEALKAQAVASRTYALKQINLANEYDMTDGSEMQVYKGSAGVNPRILEAVNSTRGEVLKYKRKLITAFFHSCCGGHTASVNSAWGEDVIKPLYGVPDPFCSNSKHYHWDFFISSKDLLTFVQKHGSTALKITGIKIQQKDNSGRALKLKIYTDSGSETVLTKDIRTTFGGFEFKSTLLTHIAAVKGGFEFQGRGWGHGVGMCQEGARTMAEKRYNYRKILRHYYPGVSIEDFE